MTIDPLLIVLLVLAPVPYWVAGLPWVAGTTAIRLAPVFGLGMVGWYAELGLMTGIGAPLAILLGLVVSLLYLVYRRPPVDECVRSLREGYLFYLLALVPTLISPFPILGVWSGDWLYMYDTGQAVMTSSRFPSELLERPPLGGAMTIPLLYFKNTLSTFQLGTAVASGAFLATIWQGYQMMGGRLSFAFIMAIATGSMFFLHHTATAWVKPLAAAMVLATIQLGWMARKEGRGWWRAALAFALAVAAHQSSILYGGFVVVLAVLPWDNARGAMKRLFTAALLGIIIVGIYEAWSIREYTWIAKVNANPAVSQRSEKVSFITNTTLCLISSIVPWSLVEEVRRLFAGPREDLTKNLYWVTTGWLTVCAGTILGLLLPFIPLLFRKRSRTSTSIVWPWVLAAGLAVIGNALLTPFYASIGIAQAGLVPLEGILLIMLASLPFVLINSGIAAGLRFSSSFREQFTLGSEGDWKRYIVPRALEPLGLSLFPAGLLLLSALIVWWFLLARQVRSERHHHNVPVRN
jgi:hypothetical protein